MLRFKLIFSLVKSIHTKDSKSWDVTLLDTNTAIKTYHFWGQPSSTHNVGNEMNIYGYLPLPFIHNENLISKIILIQQGRPMFSENVFGKYDCLVVVKG